MLADPGFATGRTNARGENAYRGRFAGAVWTEQSKNLTGMDFERDAIQRLDLILLGRLVLFLFLSGPAEHPARSRHGWRRGVHLAQVDGAYSDRHPSTLLIS